MSTLWYPNDFPSPYRDGRRYECDAPRTVAPAPARVSVWGRIGQGAALGLCYGLGFGLFAIAIGAM